MSVRSWSRSNGSGLKCWFFRIIIKKNFGTRERTNNQPTYGVDRGIWTRIHSWEASAQSKPQHHLCFQKWLWINIYKLQFFYSISYSVWKYNQSAFSHFFFFCCCWCYFVTDRFLIYLPLSEARDWNPCSPPALSLQLNVDFIVHSNSTLYLEHSTERYFCPLSKDHRVWREANVLYLYRRATICSNKTGNKLTFGQIRDGLVRFRIISISSKLFGYPGCLWGPLDHDISGPYHNFLFHAMKKQT